MKPLLLFLHLIEHFKLSDQLIETQKFQQITADSAMYDSSSSPLTVELAAPTKVLLVIAL